MKGITVTNLLYSTTFQMYPYSSHWTDVTILSAKSNLSPSGGNFPQMVQLSSSLVSKEFKKSSTRLFTCSFCVVFFAGAFPLDDLFLGPCPLISVVFLSVLVVDDCLLISYRFIIRWLKWFAFVGLTVGRCGWLC